MDRKNDKEKLKLIHPKQKQQENSSSEEEQIQQAYLQSLEKIHSSPYRTLPQSMTRQVYTQQQSKAAGKRPLYTNFPPKPVIEFGTYALQICNEADKKFRPIMGMKLTDKQQCLLDNLWHIQTMPQASSFKVQVLNALSIYFQEQSSKTPERQFKQKPNFTHYVVFRGTKLGIFNKWETAAKHIICVGGAVWRGYTSFAEALQAARTELGPSFYIEPEEVKSFSDMAKTNPEHYIKAQQEIISELKRQLEEKAKNAQDIQLKIENSLLKQKMMLLEAKNTQLLQKLEKKENKDKTEVHRTFECFRTRILDTPWQQCLKPVTERFPEFENLVSQKVCAEFPLILYNLQQQLVDMAFKFDSEQQGFKVVERTDEKGDGTGLLLLQIHHPTKLTNEQIIQFYHHGMIDYLEIKLDRKAEDLLNQLGEKMILIAGNMAIRTVTSIIGCKIISSFPYTDAYTYRPARKRIFIEHKSNICHQYHLQTSMTKTDIEFSTLPWLSHSDEKIPDSFTQFIKDHQETPELPDYYPWRNYHLVGEGHYIQVYTKPVWTMLLPFAGEGDHLQLQHIINLEDEEGNNLEDCSSPQSIDSTHRDF